MQDPTPSKDPAIVRGIENFSNGVGTAFASPFEGVYANKNTESLSPKTPSAPSPGITVLPPGLEIKNPSGISLGLSSPKETAKASDLKITPGMSALNGLTPSSPAAINKTPEKEFKIAESKKDEPQLAASSQSHTPSHARKTLSEKDAAVFKKQTGTEFNPNSKLDILNESRIAAGEKPLSSREASHSIASHSKPHRHVSQEHSSVHGSDNIQHKAEGAKDFASNHRMDFKKETGTEFNPKSQVDMFNMSRLQSGKPTLNSKEASAELANQPDVSTHASRVNGLLNKVRGVHYPEPSTPVHSAQPLARGNSINPSQAKTHHDLTR